MKGFYGGIRFLCSLPLKTVWRMRVLGRERVPASGPLIVVANHLSYFDPPTVGVALPRPLSYMAKRELFEIPVLGPLIANLNAFPVDRSKGDVAAIRRTVEILRKGEAVLVFPEGGRNRDGTAEIKSGAALLASLSGAPVLPAYIDGTRNVAGLGRITVLFGEPFLPGDGRKASREDLAKRTDEIMQKIHALREQLRAN